MLKSIALKETLRKSIDIKVKTMNNETFPTTSD